MSFRFPNRGKTFLASVRIPLPPIPCPRPRVFQNRAYYPASYNQYKAKAAEHIPSLSCEWLDPLVVYFEFVIKRPKSTKFAYPVRGDIDNFVKTACDAVTAADGYWQDDRQIVTAIAHKRWAKPDEEPHTRIDIHIHE